MSFNTTKVISHTSNRQVAELLLQCNSARNETSLRRKNAHDGRSEGSPRRYSCVLTDRFTEDLKKITVPVLVMHGDDDQIVPYADPAPLSAKLLNNGTLKTYKGFPHGMPTTQADTINADLLAFLKS
jgi:pimeloyl-ACP methyl ester carboxylesterase